MRYMDDDDDEYTDDEKEKVKVIEGGPNVHMHDTQNFDLSKVYIDDEEIRSFS